MHFLLYCNITVETLPKLPNGNHDKEHLAKFRAYVIAYLIVVARNNSDWTCWNWSTVHRPWFGNSRPFLEIAVLINVDVHGWPRIEWWILSANTNFETNRIVDWRSTSNTKRQEPRHGSVHKRWIGNFKYFPLFRRNFYGSKWDRCRFHLRLV